MGFGRYIKAAFANRWNLLALFGGVGLAAVSGIPDIVLPLVLAAEAAYLGLLGAHPKFQKYVDAQAAASERSSKSQSSQQRRKHMLQHLPPPALSRAAELRANSL